MRRASNPRDAFMPDRNWTSWQRGCEDLNHRHLSSVFFPRRHNVAGKIIISAPWPSLDTTGEAPDTVRPGLTVADYDQLACALAFTHLYPISASASASALILSMPVAVARSSFGLDLLSKRHRLMCTDAELLFLSPWPVCLGEFA